MADNERFSYLAGLACAGLGGAGLGQGSELIWAVLDINMHIIVPRVTMRATLHNQRP